MIFIVALINLLIAYIKSHISYLEKTIFHYGFVFLSDPIYVLHFSKIIPQAVIGVISVDHKNSILLYFLSFFVTRFYMIQFTNITFVSSKGLFC